LSISSYQIDNNLFFRKSIDKYSPDWAAGPPAMFLSTAINSQALSEHGPAASFGPLVSEKLQFFGQGILVLTEHTKIKK
jgi:hypothetical protein